MPKKSTAAPASYAAAVEELEQLIDALESGQLPLEDLLAQYRRGNELLQ
ncbi:MAG: exodeoxyribonuclease VII small subunit, partial [Rhodoferax sp.]|nr:exodeoxyribonuclease VII small subunit [Rhodoferax sp.]